MMCPERDSKVCEGWPDETDTPELAAFARGIEAALPAVDGEMLQRVEATMNGRIRRTRLQMIVWRIGVSAAAAVVLVAIGFNAWMGHKPAAPQVVREEVRITLTTTAYETPAGPVVPFERYEGLLGNR